MEPLEDWKTVPYRKELGANLRAARSRAGLSQESAAKRMRRLGYSHFLYQTVGSCERGTRRVTAEEVLGFCLAYSCTIPSLMGPAMEGDHLVEIPGGHHLGAASVQRLAYGVWDRSIVWADDEDFSSYVFASPGTAKMGELVTALQALGGVQDEVSRPLFTDIPGQEHGVRVADDLAAFRLASGPSGYYGGKRAEGDAQGDPQGGDDGDG